MTAAAQINPIAQGLTTATPEQRTEAATQIRSILTANNLDADTYNAIASQAQTDAALATRIANNQRAELAEYRMAADWIGVTLGGG